MSRNRTARRARRLTTLAAVVSTTALAAACSSHSPTPMAAPATDAGASSSSAAAGSSAAASSSKPAAVPEALTFGQYGTLTLGQTVDQVTGSGYTLGPVQRGDGCDMYSATSPSGKKLSLGFATGTGNLAVIQVTKGVGTSALPAGATNQSAIRAAYPGATFTTLPAGADVAQFEVDQPGSKAKIYYSIDSNGSLDQPRTAVGSPGCPDPGVIAPPAAGAAANGTPVLGRSWAPYQTGYGGVRPVQVYNGGDPTGRIWNIDWTSWGGPQATGTGTSFWVGPNQIVAQATQQPATVVAFDLGVCNGKLMYQAVDWYFPGEGQKFNPAGGHYNICTGVYVSGH